MTKELATYVLTHNAPEQLDRLFKSFAEADISFFRDTDVIVINQSTGMVAEYDEICERFSVQQVRVPNQGTSGGRFVAARLFDRSDYQQMFFFEDDMLLRPPTDDRRCRFGFPGYLPELCRVARDILANEALSYLKLSFHEYFCDHSRDFPNDRPAAFEKLGCREIGYFVGDVYYSNWPMIISQEANRQLFHDPVVTEGEVMNRASDLIASKKIRAGVLAAFPVEHIRLRPRSDDWKDC